MKPSDVKVLLIEYFKVDFHGHLRHIQSQILEQTMYGHVLTHVARVSIDVNVHERNASTNVRRASDPANPVCLIDDDIVSDHPVASYESLFNLVNLSARPLEHDGGEER